MSNARVGAVCTRSFAPILPSCNAFFRRTLAAVGDTLLTTLLVCLGYKQVRCNSYGSLRALGVWLSQNLFVNSVDQLAHELALELLDTPD